MALTGRSRRPQMDLAKERGLEDYPQPAGGCCFLTDAQYSRRLKDFFNFNKKEELTHETVILLKVGRHFRVSEKIKAIVGRNERENNFLKTYEKGRHTFSAEDYPSAHMLAEIKQEPGPEDLRMLASIVARYSDAEKEKTVRIEHRYADRTQFLEASALTEEQIEKWRI